MTIVTSITRRPKAEKSEAETASLFPIVTVTSHMEVA